MERSLPDTLAAKFGPDFSVFEIQTGVWIPRCGLGSGLRAQN